MLLNHKGKQRRTTDGGDKNIQHKKFFYGWIAGTVFSTEWHTYLDQIGTYTKKIKCFGCNEIRQYTNECPEVSEEVQLL